MRHTTWRQVYAEVKSHTMACWWPSRITGRTIPDWDGVVGELDALVEGAKTRLGYNAAMQGEVLRLSELRQWAQSQAR